KVPPQRNPKVQIDRTAELARQPVKSRTSAMSPINEFLKLHELAIATNPCISPDFCLDWSRLQARLKAAESLTVHEHSRFETAVGWFTLLEDRSEEHTS